MAVIAGLWLAMAGAPLQARQQEPAPPTTDDQDYPLEVTIRPRSKPVVSGFMQDGVLATDDGRYFLYTGWYIDRLGERLAPGSLADRALRMGLTDTVLDIIREDPARDPLYIQDIGLILGGRYRDLSMLQVADMFQVELGPTPFPGGGFYARPSLDEPWSLADQIIGKVDFSGSTR